MKSFNRFLLVFTGICFLFSCEKQPPVNVVPTPEKPISELRKITLTASLPALTKSELQDGEKVVWTPGDKISVFLGTGQAEFTSTNTEPVSTADFTGYIETPANLSDEDLSLYGIYPYSASNALSDGIVTVSLPAEQPAVAGTFADDLSISVGHSTGTAMTFYNVCGVVEVSVSRADVKKVSLSGLGDEVLAGTLSVSIGAGGIPSVTGIADGSTSVTVSAPEGEYLDPAATYYLVLAPKVLEQGVKVGVETDEALMIKRIEKPLEVKRSVISVLSRVDEGALPEFVPFADASFKAYCVENFDTDGDGEISLAEAEAVTRIECSEREISSLSGIKYFTHLTELYCGNNRLTELDLSGNTMLKRLDCGGNLITVFEPRGNPSLEYLYLAGNELERLDVSSNTALVYLDITGCRLTSLDLSKNLELSALGCYGNQLSSLDVTKNVKLQYMECAVNHLTALDLSQNTSLVTLYCFSNELTSLDLSNNPLLEDLFCDSNRLTSLDLSMITSLTRLHAFLNQLTELDCSKNAALKELMCGENQLTVLDVSNNSNLKILDCGDNPMEYVLVPFGNSYETINIPEGTQLIQKAGSSTEDFTREIW